MKRILAIVLSALMAISLVPAAGWAAEEPEGTFSLQSLMPLEEENLYLDLTDRFPEELKAFPISEIKASTTSYGGDESPIEGTAVAYTKYYYYDENGDYVNRNDNYVTVSDNDTIDLRSFSTWTERFYLVLITGENDQLNLNNKKYTIRVNIKSDISDMFEFSLADKDRNAITIYNYDIYNRSIAANKFVMNVSVNSKQYGYREESYLSFSLSEQYRGLNVKVYEGYYTDAGSASEAKEITDSIFNQEDLTVAGGYYKNYSYKSNYKGMPEITIILSRNENIVFIQPCIVYVYGSDKNVSSNSLCAEDSSFFGYKTSARWYTQYKWENNIEHITYELRSGYSVVDNYYLSLWFDNPADQDSEYGLEYVKKAVKGYYSTENAIPETARDIKEELFSDAYDVDGGYKDRFDSEIIFTIVDTEGELYWIGVKVVPYSGDEILPSEPEPESQDTYFVMEGADKVSDANLSSYLMPYDADSYYYNGYQTVFLMDRSGQGQVKLSDSKIRPRFFAGNKVSVFAGENQSSGTKQVSGESEISFENGKVIQYSAAAGNGKHLKNYWVTFLTQAEGGPKLFVNAANDESRLDESATETEPIYKREVFLTEEYNNHHDVFVANIGDAPITNLYAKLSADAENVALDDYWKIGATKTLSAFTSTYSSEMKNMAKIRLIPELDANGVEKSGIIKGTLEIGYGDEANPTEKIIIKLTGVAGSPKITTEDVVDGVKYVPYSSVIQTNNMYASDAISFSISSGKLPSGLTLKQNGEIYGMPNKTGDYTFTVKAENTILKQSDSKEFTITINNNTDENVEAANNDAQGHALTTRVPAQDFSADTVANSRFVSVGGYNDFVAFYIDGNKLTEGRDYESEEGSTVITIYSQTFQNAGNGTHTIAAEFRSGKEETGELKRTAQNVEVSGIARKSSGKSVPSGTVVGNVDITDDNQIDESGAQEVDNQENQNELKFIDVKPSEWFYDAVKEAYEAGFMSGIDENIFEPGRAASREEIMTVLARYAKAEALTLDEGVEWAVENGISDGSGRNDPVTREQFITMLWRYMGEPEREVEIEFTDEDKIDEWAIKAMKWAISEGILQGYGDGTLQPTEFVTRAQIAAIMVRTPKDEIAE